MKRICQYIAVFVACYSFSAKAQLMLPEQRGNAVKEEAVTIETDQFKLPGTLTLPTEGRNFPVVILVHGSGPNDRDEKVGANKPFRDLALDLAAKGIATIRYDKRTLVYKTASAPIGKKITPEEETIQDALSAVKLAQTQPALNKQQIYLAGHSLGGYLMPRIASRCTDLAGIILLAANARPLETLIEEQIRYLLGLQGKTDEALIQAAIGQTMQAMSFEYLNYLKQYNPVETAAGLRVPILILQGERDYQVTMEDFGIWKNALQGKAGVTLKSYPELNHLFMQGKGKSVPDEYNKAGQVAVYVATDIANWIKNR